MPVICTNEPPPFGNLARQMGKLVDQYQKGFYSFMPSNPGRRMSTSTKPSWPTWFASIWRAWTRKRLISPSPNNG